MFLYWILYMKNNFNFEYKHSLGQNFLVDEFILEDIADASGIDKEDFVLEIGAGNGALTRCLLDRAKCVVTIEIDKRLIPLLNSNLKNYKNVIILNCDFLKLNFDEIIVEFEKFGFDKMKNHIKIVANLPYYITSQILNVTLINPYISELTIMVQKEVAERIVAKPNTKDFGILTLSCNYFSSAEFLFVVNKNSFYPVPKVDSAVLKLVKYEKFIDVSNRKNFNITDDESYKKLFKTIKAGFMQRRKKLLNSLSSALSIDKKILNSVFQKLNFDENIRAENLSLLDYEKLSELL